MGGDLGLLSKRFKAPLEGCRVDIRQDLGLTGHTWRLMGFSKYL